MVKLGFSTIVVYDRKPDFRRKPDSGSSSSDQHDAKFSISRDSPRKSLSQLDLSSDELNIKSLLKEVECFGSTGMTWKERKKLEDKKVVALGGKPSKKQRLPLSVARGAIKKQKLLEQKKQEEDLILGQYMKSSKRKQKERRKPEDSVLMATEGHFSGGVLNVKHLLKPCPSRVDDGMNAYVSHKGSRKIKGKKKGKKRKH